MKFGINQSISQTITQLSCIQLETPSSRLWNFWWIKTYTTFKGRWIINWVCVWLWFNTLMLSNLDTCCEDNTVVHYNDVIMGMMASQITSLTIVYSSVYSGADQRKHQSSTSLAFVWGIHRGPVNSPHKWPVTQKCFHLMMSSCKLFSLSYFINGNFTTN